MILDRTLAQDDWRGLGEGADDNVPTISRFVLTVETLTDSKPLKVSNVKNYSKCMFYVFNYLTRIMETSDHQNSL